MTTALVTGATGTFGGSFVRRLIGEAPHTLEPWTIRGLSRDELKQAELRDALALEYPDTHTNLRLLLGDVRDRDRLRRAMEGCDLVIHAAALKHVTAGETNPDEFVKTNVLGSLNVIECCHDTGVEKAVLLSSDKAVSPANLYGATKLCAEKMWLAANSIPPTRFSVVRYGNVKGSRGSLLTKKDPVLTDRRATRFWMEPAEAVDLVLLALREMQGGEVFVPKLESGLVSDHFPEDARETGLRAGEKLHESLISPEEVARTYDFGDHYRVLPAHYGWNHPDNAPIAQLVPPDFTYTSEG